MNDARVALDLSGVVLLKPLTDPGTGPAKDPVLATWEEIIQQANLPLEGERLDAVAHFVEGVRRELVKNTDLQDQARVNSKSQFDISPKLHGAVSKAVMNSMESHHNLSVQALGDKTKMHALLKMLSELVYEELQA